MSERGLLVVVSGPSGVGKGTVMKELVRKNDGIYLSVSATTREKREGEADGVNYHFMSEEDFIKTREENGFIESACFCGNYYGTPKKEVFARLDAGINVVLEIEVQGAMKVRSEYPEGVYIFMAPPSMSELRSRLENRKTESRDKVEERLKTAVWEMGVARKYNYLVINDSVVAAAERISSIITAEALRMERNFEFIKKNIAEDR